MCLFEYKVSIWLLTWYNVNNTNNLLVLLYITINRRRKNHYTKCEYYYIRKNVHLMNTIYNQTLYRVYFVNDYSNHHKITILIN